MEQNNPSTLFMVRSTLQEWTKEKELQTQRIASNNLGQEGYLWSDENIKQQLRHQLNDGRIFFSHPEAKPKCYSPFLNTLLLIITLSS